MKKITLLKSFILAVIFLMGSVSVWGAYSGTDTFNKISTTDQIETGAYYVLYGINGTNTGAMSNTVASGKMGLSAVTFNGNSIVDPSMNVVWKIEGNTTTGFTLYNEAAGMFCEITTNSTSGFALNASSTHTYNVTVSTDNFFFMSNSSSGGSRGISIYLTDFRPYASSAAKTLNLYKLGTSSACTPSTLAFSNTTVNKTMADAAFTQTATSLNGTTAITYASNNTEVANVNETTGEITLVSAGVATITATQAAGTHSADDYCAATATYTLNVATILPTITVVEVFVPEMVAQVGNTVTETVNVSGINLDENLTISIVDDVDNQFDEPSVSSITKLGDNTASGTITVTYRPTAAGAHTATLKIESLGATSLTRALNGSATWVPLATPVATTATAINNSGFTANWETVSGATEYQLDVYTKDFLTATDLIISEYIEGSSYNKAIEIYNGTGATVDLSNYSIKKQTNGAGVYGSELLLSGNLADGDVYVIAYVSGSNSASAEILSETDLQTSSNAVNFNGNDAIALFNGEVQIDEIGIFDQISPDWGSNTTFVRKNSVASPVVPYNTNDWTTYAIDYTENLGMHSIFSITPVPSSPFTVVGETSKAISGLSAETTYNYTVIAKNTNVTSTMSNEMAVVTGPTTSVDQLGDKLNIYVSDNKIEFESSANETVSIYNAVGQKLVQKLTVSGLNSIPVSARGVVLVKVGNRFAKVIL